MSNPQKIQELKKTLESLNYTKISKNTPRNELQDICCEIDKFFSIEYKTNIDDFANGKTKLSSQEIQAIQAIFPTPNYLKKLLAWNKGEDWEDPNDPPTNLCQDCQTNPAQHKLTENGKEINLCQDCKAKRERERERERERVKMRE